jgi:hypothetical protein
MTTPMSGRVFDMAKYHHAQVGAGRTAEQAYVHGGMLFVWLARRGLLEAELRGLVDEALARGDTISAVYAELADGVLAEEELTPTGAAFLSVYMPEEEGEAGMPSFWDDLLELEAQTGGPWTTPDDELSALRFAARLDQRFAEWRAAGSPSVDAPATQVYERTRDPAERYPAIPADPALEVALVGIPGPWPAWNRLTVWRPDSAEQAAAAQAVSGEWMGFVATDRPCAMPADPGRVGALVWVERRADDGRIWFALPGLRRFRVIGPASAGRAAVALVRDPKLRLEPQLRAVILAVDPAWRADSLTEPGTVADRVAWGRIGNPADLRRLVEATDPFARLEVALRLTSRG